MELIKRKKNLILLILTVPLIDMLYNFFNYSDNGVKNLVTDIDKGIPFIKAFVIPYLLWVPFIFAVLFYFMMKDEKTLVTTVLTIDICLLICFLIYFSYQTTVPRPVVQGNDLLSIIVNMVYKNDRPFNCFPSIHCLTCFVMIRAISTSKVRNAINFLLISSMSLIIIFSTMFIKQHVVLDALSAAILGDFVYRFIFRFDKEKAISWIRRQYSLLTMRKKSEI